MLGRAESRFARPRDHLAHVEMQVLAALGDGAVERPDRDIARQQREDGALAAPRVGERIEQAVEEIGAATPDSGYGQHPPSRLAAAADRLMAPDLAASRSP